MLSLEASTFISVFNRLSLSAQFETSGHILCDILSSGGIDSMLRYDCVLSLLKEQILTKLKNDGRLNELAEKILCKFIVTSSNRNFIGDLYFDGQSYDLYVTWFFLRHEWQRCYNDNDGNLVLINEHFDDMIDFDLEELNVRPLNIKTDIIENNGFSIDKLLQLTFGESVENLDFDPDDNDNDHEWIFSGQKVEPFLRRIMG